MQYDSQAQKDLVLQAIGAVSYKHKDREQVAETLRPLEEGEVKSPDEEKEE